MEKNELIAQVMKGVNEIKRTEKQMGPRLDPLQGMGYVLYHLRDRGGTTVPSELSLALNMTMPRMSIILRKLEDSGMLTRTQDGVDRRKVRVAMTAEGEEAVRRYDEEQREMYSALCDRIGEEDMQVFLRGLTALRDVMKERIGP